MKTRGVWGMSQRERLGVCYLSQCNDRGKRGHLGSQTYFLNVRKGLPFETIISFIILGSMMKAAAYMRVSTAGQNPDLQRDGIAGFAERAGLHLVAWYLDVAVSGRKEDRPQLDVLMKAARDRAFDCVLVWKFDRFARSTSHLINALEEFNQIGRAHV